MRYWSVYAVLAISVVLEFALSSQSFYAKI